MVLPVPAGPEKIKCREADATKPCFAPLLGDAHEAELGADLGFDRGQA